MDDTLTRTLEELYRAHHGRVYRRALILLRRREDAEDVVQEVFIRLAKLLRKAPDDLPGIGAIVHVTTHACIDRWRKLQRRREVPADPMEDLSGVFRSEDEEASIMARDILMKLPEKLRDVALYYYVDGLTLDEIATMTGATLKTIWRRKKKIDAALSKNS